jgi:dipeptidyl aminopeptidase/acylaminoacyl peptidase
MSRITADPDFEPRIADWLEADPDHAPAPVLSTVLAAFPSIPQRRASRVPWRSPIMTRFAFVAAAGVLVALLGIGVFVAGSKPPAPSPAPANGATPVPLSPSPSPAAAFSPAASPQADWSFLPGRLLVEHLGNALDLSEASEKDPNASTRRFWFMDPTDMTAATVTEFLKGQPTTGKSAADISRDGRKIVFQDYVTDARLYEANLDGTGLHKLPVDCNCVLLYPDYDPTATKVVYLRIQHGQSWLEILDLPSGTITKLPASVGSSGDAVPEQPAWSPDGTTIAFNRITWGPNDNPDIGTVHFGDRPPQSGTLSLLLLATGKVTDLPIPTDLSPGDASWSPDGRTILFTSNPLSTTAGVAAAGFSHQNYAINVDGTGLQAIPGRGSPEYLPDGAHVLFKSECDDGVSSELLCNGKDNFGVMRADFSDPLRVKVNGIDVTEVPQGFSQIGHWIDTP